MTNEVADLSDRLRLASVEIDALKITLELQRMLDAKPKDKRRA